MSMAFDATLKDLARDYPRDFLQTFGQPSSDAISTLNVDLSTVTTATDAVFGIGDPLREIVQFDFQSSASAKKHAGLLAYNALLFRQYLTPFTA